MRFPTWLRIGFLTLVTLLALAQGAKSDFVYHITVDTTTISSQVGYIDLQFNPGVDSLAASVAIRKFSTDGLLASISDNLGGAAGTVPGPPDVIISNSSAFNDLFQGITFGSSITFDAEFSGPALNPNPPLSFFGSVFALSLLGSDTVTPLLTSSFDGSLVRIDINPDGSTTATTYPDTSGVYYAVATLQSVPEPSSFWMMGVGFLGLLGGKIVIGRGQTIGIAKPGSELADPEQRRMDWQLDATRGE